MRHAGGCHLESHGLCGIIGGIISIYFGRDLSASY